ncbi:MAG TPA: hypothetical protein VL326_37825 [Kofleriaceae bacterium]|jgi:hypothetical protein|nr:hypothetical protein [Kofleriaceae bacterium]
MRWLAALLTITGCDSVFSVDHVRLTIDAPVDAVEPCPSMNYVTVNGAPPTSTYRYVPNMGFTWDAAALACKSDSMTGVTHLVVFETVGEMSAVRSLVPPTPPYWQVFTGYARNSNSHGGSPFQFTSVTGVPLAQTDSIWETASYVEPDDGGVGGQETITFFEMTRNLTDGPADIQRGFLCECDGTPANQMFQIRD